MTGPEFILALVVVTVLTVVVLLLVTGRINPEPRRLEHVPGLGFIDHLPGSLAPGPHDLREHDLRDQAADGCGGVVEHGEPHPSFRTRNHG